MKTGLLNLDLLDKPYMVVVQLRHQPNGVMHQVALRPDKVRQTMRACSLGEMHKSAVIMIGESPGDQAHGWQFPENVHVVAVLGLAIESESSAVPWTWEPIE